MDEPAYAKPRPELEADFDRFTERAGLDVPAEWREGAMDSYSSLMRAIALLHASPVPDRWPSYAYRIEPFSRRRGA